VLVADDTAFPACARWIEQVPPHVRVEALLTTSHPDGDRYPFPAGESVYVRWVDSDTELLGALQHTTIGARTYVFAAGEAGALVAPRRHLRHVRGLPAAQLSVQGYWRRGVANLDHHAPVDPDDPAQ
jgi:NADPH-dependent ferric siderophore reductase